MKPVSLCLYAFLLLALPVCAESEHDQARKAVKAGELMPLEQILQKVEKNSPGKVLKVELERKGGIWIYEIKLLRDGGALSRLRLDARDGTLLESAPSHGHRPGRRGGGKREEEED